MLPLVLLAAAVPPPDALSGLEAALAAQPSATAALQGWCAARHLANPATITAAPVQGDDAPPPADLPARLALGPGAKPGYRHVRLSCGGVVLSQAHNWYAADRLTPAMNATLASTSTPFGTVVAPLHFTRERAEATRGPLPGCPADTVLAHAARLTLPDGAPLAWVVECYTPAALQPAP